MFHPKYESYFRHSLGTTVASKERFSLRAAVGKKLGDAYGSDTGLANRA